MKLSTVPKAWQQARRFTMDLSPLSTLVYREENLSTSFIFCRSIHFHPQTGNDNVAILAAILRLQKRFHQAGPRGEKTALGLIGRVMCEMNGRPADFFFLLFKQELLFIPTAMAVAVKVPKRRC